MSALMICPESAHIVKGLLTYVPPVNMWRLRRKTTGGPNSAR